MQTTITSADGTRLAARRSGIGTPLVLVHGAMANLDVFAPIEEKLAEHHTVWVYSRRGRGGSEDGADYTLEREIEDVLAVLEATGDAAHVFGHSSGAYYTLLAAPRARGLRSLILYEPPLNAGDLDPAVMAEIENALAAADPDRALVTFFPIAAITDDEVAAIREMEPVWNMLREGVYRFPREAKALMAHARSMLAEAKLPDVPMLYLYGELTAQPVFPAIDDVRRRWPKARLHGFSRQRHMAQTFDPDAFVDAILRFTSGN